MHIQSRNTGERFVERENMHI